MGRGDTPVDDAAIVDPSAPGGLASASQRDLTPPVEPAAAEAAAAEPAVPDRPKYSDSRVDEQTGITWIWLHHPKTQGEFEATVEAYEQEDGWKERGWEPGRLPEAVASTPAVGGVA